MSPPLPETVQVPLLSDWLPANAGLPMSAQLQPLTHGTGGGGAVVASDTTSMVALPIVVGAAEVTASPASIVGLTLRTRLLPGTTVQVAPSGEVYAVKVLPERA